MTDTQTEIVRLTEENARLRKVIDRLEEESNDHYEDYKAAKERLKALASYLKLVKVAVDVSVNARWRRNSLKAALSYLASGAEDRIKSLSEVSVNDTFREAWHILQYWDFDLDPDPKLLKELQSKYGSKKPTRP